MRKTYEIYKKDYDNGSLCSYASSMVGISASASDSYNENTLEVATTYNDGYVNPNHCGTYYASNGSFIQVSETQVLFYQVNYDSYPKLSGVAYSFSMGTTGYTFQ